MWRIPVLSILVLTLIITTLVSSVSEIPTAAAISVTTMVALITLIIQGNRIEFANWIRFHLDLSPPDGSMWFVPETGTTLEDHDYTNTIIDSYPTEVILIIVLIQSIIIYSSLFMGEVNN